MYILLLFASLLAAGAPAPSHLSIPARFEPSPTSAVRYTSVNHRDTATFAPDGVTITSSDQTSFRLSFPNSNPDPAIEGAGRLPGISSYFLGNDPAKWRTAVPHFSRIVYKDLYPGIDAVFYFRDKELEFDFLVQPKADPALIRLEIPGAVLTPSGTLEIRSGKKSWTIRKPVTTQSVAGQVHPVASGFQPVGAGRFAFEIGNYDPSIDLIIDPSIVSSVVLDSSDLPSLVYVAMDAAGYLYAAGNTDGRIFPGLELGLSRSIHVTKLAPESGNVLYTVFCGGIGQNAYPSAITVDSTGSVSVVGSTESITFPVVNPFQSKLKGYSDGILFKLNPAGTALTYSTYLGGSHDDVIADISLDPAGNAVLVGHSKSPDFPFAAPLSTAYETQGMRNVFAAKLTAAGNALLYSTYLGAGYPSSVTVDSAGNAYLFGLAYSGVSPQVVTTAGAFSSTMHSEGTLFVTKINPTGSARIYSTFLDISGRNFVASQITVDPAGNAIFSGGYSDIATNKSYNFVGRLNGTASQRTLWKLWPVAFGRSVANAPARDGTIYVAGTGDYMFVGKDSLFPPRNLDAFLGAIDPLTNDWRYLTLVGGSAEDQGSRVFVASDGLPILFGYTSSPDFPLSPPRANVGAGTFLAKLANCAVTATIDNTAFSIPGGPGSIQVTAAPACDWVAETTVPWINLTTTSGSGNATVPFTVAPYSGYASRTGTIAIRGVTFRITQTGLSCTYTLVSSQTATAASGGMVSAEIRAGAECTWTAASPRAWAAITSATAGNGNSVISISVAPNPGTERSATLNIGGQPFTINQATAPTSPQPVFHEPLTVPGGIPSPGRFRRVRAADMNGDGRADVVASSGDISVFLGEASGNLSRTGFYPVPRSNTTDFLVTQHLIADLNGDGKLDVVAGASFGSDYRLIFYPGNGDGTLGTPQLTPLPYATFLTSVADLNNDNKLDVVFASGSEYLVYLGAGNGSFSGTRIINVSPQQANENTMISDLNRDGILDLAYCNLNLTLFRGVSFFGYAVTGREIPLAFTTFQCILHDVNLDNKPDLIAVTGNGIYAYFGNGDTTFSQGPASPITNETYFRPGTFALGDLDSDGLADMAVVHQIGTGSAIATALGDQFGRFHSPRFLATAYHDSLAIADINGDGRRDIVANSGDALSVYLNATVSRSLLPPTVVGSTPLRGETASSKIDVTVTNPRGWQDTDVVNVLVNSAIDGRRACYLAYSVAANALYLVDDAGNAAGPLAGGLVPGSNATIANSQCSIKGATSSVSGSRDTLVLSLDVTFLSSWSGNRVVYSAVRDKSGRNSGWRPTATWSIPTPAFPLVAVREMVPPYESLPPYRSLVLRFSHRTDWSNLGILNVLINDAIDGRNACYFAHNVATGETILVNDAGDAGGPFAGTLIRPSSDSIWNKQCRLIGDYTSWSGGLPSGTNDYVLTLHLMFQAPFRGPRLVFAAARDKNDLNNTGWQAVGLLNLY